MFKIFTNFVVISQFFEGYKPHFLVLFVKRTGEYYGSFRNDMIYFFISIPEVVIIQSTATFLPRAQFCTLNTPSENNLCSKVVLVAKGHKESRCS